MGKWFDVQWKNKRDEVGYIYAMDIYRPTVKVNEDTPSTFKELTKEQIKKAQAQKSTHGRVKTFDK